MTDEILLPCGNLLARLARSAFTERKAEHVFAMMQTFTRSILQAREFQKEHRWEARVAREYCYELSGKTMGVIGYGANRAYSRTYAQRQAHSEATNIAYLLNQVYTYEGSAGLQGALSKLAKEYRARVIVYAGNAVVLDTAPGHPPTCNQKPFQFPLATPGMPVYQVLLCLPDPNLGFLAILRALLLPGVLGLLGALAAVLLVSRRIAVPLAGLARAAQRFGEGDLTIRVPVRGPGEIADVAAEFNRMAQGLEEGQRQRQARSRAGSGADSFRFRLIAVADAVHRAHRARPHTQLLAQVGHVYVDIPVEAGEIRTGDMVEQLLPGEGSPRRGDEGVQQPKLSRRHADVPAVDGDPVHRRVEFDGAGAERLGGVCARPCPPQDGLDPQYDLGRAERLGDVVVRAVLQTPQPILFRGACGEHDHGDVALGAQAAADLQPADPGQHQVEDHKVRALHRDARERLLAVSAGVDGVARAFEIHAQQALDVHGIIHQQDPLIHALKYNRHGRAIIAEMLRHARAGRIPRSP